MDGYSRDSHSHKSKHHHHQHGRHSRRHHHRHRKSSSDSNQAEFESVPPPPPPPPPPPQPAQPTNPVKEKNYKLLVDPCLIKGSKKMYRYDGVVPGEPSMNVTSIKDPRPSIPRRWTLPDTLNLPVPKFKIDNNYVGVPPEVEITITNLNDNIDKHFLTDLVVKHGELEEVSIYYHPITRRHAGFARVVFTEVSAAASCVDTLHNRSVMGKQLVVFCDPFGREWSRMIDNIVAPKREILPPVDSDEENYMQSLEKMRDRPQPIAKIDNVREEMSRGASTSSATLPPEEDGGSSPFSHKTPACNPSPISINVPAFPIPPPIVSNVQLPNFNRPPPPIAARSPWPVHNEWQNPSMQWGHPPPPSWPPRFMSPPPSAPPSSAPLPPEKDNPLDLDTRIELLLKGGINGMAPPFLAMDINEESKQPAPVEEPKVVRSRASSLSSEEEPYSPPPLPPGVDLSPTYSPKVPLPALSEFSSDKYLPLSTPPSPFQSEELYLECLLNCRLKHLSYVQQREKEVSKRKGRQFESDKVSEISSEEDENDFKQTANNNDDDRMSLSSLSSAIENIEEVAVPSNPYGSFTFGESSVHGQAYPHMDVPKMHPHMQGNWHEYQGQMYPGFQPSHLPYNPLHPPPMMPGQFHHYPPHAMEPVIETDPINRTVDLALEKVCELLTATLEKDLMKRMTEVLAFNEFEKWWDDEEKKYNEDKKEPEKEKESVKDEAEEKKPTADVFFNSLIDSNYDGTTLGVGFRAALPKMPSFKRKQRLPSPGRGEHSANFDKDKRNESDEEEMVQLSDSESRGNEPDFSLRRKKTNYSDSSDSSAVESSESSSEESEQESSESDIEKEFNNSKEDFLKLIDMEKLESLRIKTPEGRHTPVPTEDISDFEDAKSPEDNDSRTSSPDRSRDLRKYAMEAFKALGLDEFVCDVKIRNDGPSKVVKPKPKLAVQPVPSTSGKSSKPVKVEKAKPKVEVIKEPAPKIETVKTEAIVKKDEKPVKNIEVEDDSEATLSPPDDIISVEHSYSRPKALEAPKIETKVESWALDHDYSGRQEKVKEKEVVKEKVKEIPKVKETVKDTVKSTTKERKKKSEKLVSHLLDSYLKAPIPRTTRTFEARDALKEMMTCYEFLTKGVDEEDIKYLKKAFEGLLSDEKQSYWLNEMHWANHPVTDLQAVTSKRNKGHKSGCARTQGFYKLDPKEKQKLKHHYGKNKIPSESMQSNTDAKVWTAASREARSNQRRLLTAFGADTDSDLLKFNQLKFRKKLLKFGKSEIHDWGLFAMEPIAADEMVVEYVGQKVRPVLADYREQKYMKRGIGSSYLFRIDLENIIDATTRGNLARFINHSCNPNCYAKIITIEGSKKIVIYSKRDIKMDEEITYDYKFPLEEEKIPCLCGDALCKGFLN